jgi:hypothetical protein
MITNFMIKNKDEVLTEILCKGCGIVIQSMREVGPVAVHRDQDSRIRTVRVALMPNTQYKEITIQCTDAKGRRSAHVTHLCKKCIVTYANNTAALQEFMRMDLQWQVENEGGSLFHKELITRKVTGVE